MSIILFVVHVLWGVWVAVTPFLILWRFMRWMNRKLSGKVDS